VSPKIDAPTMTFEIEAFKNAQRNKRSDALAVGR
jgi:hypothetical protein